MSNASIWRRLASSLCCSSGSALIHTCHPRCHLHIAGIPGMMSIVLTPVGLQRRARIAVLQCLHVTTPSMYSSMVPGNLPSQLEILSTGQTYIYQQHQATLLTACHIHHAYASCGNPGLQTQFSFSFHIVMHTLRCIMHLGSLRT